MYSCRVCTRCIGDTAIFNKYFGRKYRSEVLAVGGEQTGRLVRVTLVILLKAVFCRMNHQPTYFAGDQISHLQWRLLHGDIPAVHHPIAAVVLIGINDLGAAADCSQGNPDIITEAAKGVISRSDSIAQCSQSSRVLPSCMPAGAVSQYSFNTQTSTTLHRFRLALSHLHRLEETIKLLKAQLPETQLVMLALLPRGDGSDASTTFQWPGRYTPAIQTVNAWLEDAAAEDEGITFLDCGDQLLQDGQVPMSPNHPGLPGCLVSHTVQPFWHLLSISTASLVWFCRV